MALKKFYLRLVNGILISIFLGVSLAAWRGHKCSRSKAQVLKTYDLYVNEARVDSQDKNEQLERVISQFGLIRSFRVVQDHCDLFGAVSQITVQVLHISGRKTHYITTKGGVLVNIAVL